jgi:hypothetical protein
MAVRAKGASTVGAQTEAGMVGTDDPVVCGRPVSSACRPSRLRHLPCSKQNRLEMHVLQLVDGGAQR